MARTSDDWTKPTATLADEDATNRVKAKKTRRFRSMSFIAVDGQVRNIGSK